MNEQQKGLCLWPCDVPHTVSVCVCVFGGGLLDDMGACLGKGSRLVQEDNWTELWTAGFVCS